MSTTAFVSLQQGISTELLYFMAKLFPSVLQFGLACAGLQTSLIKHVLKNSPESCPSLLVPSTEVNKILDKMGCISLISNESTRIQSLIGLGLTLLTSLLLSTNQTFSLATSLGILGLFIISIKVIGEPPKEPQMKKKALVFSFACFVFGIIFIMASYVNI